MRIRHIRLCRTVIVLFHITQLTILINCTGEFLQGQRLEIVVSLHHITACLLQIPDLTDIIYSFGYSTDLHLTGDFENCFYYKTVPSIVIFTGEEAAVHFNRIHIQLPQQMQQHRTAAKSVQRTAEIAGMDCLHNLADCRHILLLQGSAQFKLNQFRSNAVLLRQAHIRLQEIFLTDSLMGQIYRNRARRLALFLPLVHMQANLLKQIQIKPGNQMIFFQQRNKHFRFQHTTFRMPPA